MKISCGAVFYAYDPDGNLGVILGLEGNDYLQFKGCNEVGETYEMTAAREIKEETCGLVNISPTDILLEHMFTSKRKHYYIGLCKVEYDIVEKFAALRVNESRKEYREKKMLKFFPIETVLTEDSVHNISKASIRYYWDKLKMLDVKNQETKPPPDKDNTRKNEKMRKHSVSVTYSRMKFANIIEDLSVSGSSASSSDSSQENSPTYQSITSEAVTRDEFASRRSLRKPKPVRDRKRTSTLLRRPDRFGLRHTPLQERIADQNKQWRI